MLSPPSSGLILEGEHCPGTVTTQGPGVDVSGQGSLWQCWEQPLRPRSLRLCPLEATLCPGLWPGVGGPPADSTHTGERGPSQAPPQPPASFAAHLTVHPTPGFHSSTLLVTAGTCMCEPRSERPSKTSAFRHGALLGRGPLAISTPGWQQGEGGPCPARASQTTTASQPFCARLLCAPLAAPFPAHLALCRHPCMPPSPVPGLKHRRRRWNVPGTPMSLGSVLPPPGWVSLGQCCRPAWCGVGMGGGRGNESPDTAPGWQEGAVSFRLGSSQSYFYGKEGARSRLGEESPKP